MNEHIERRLDALDADLDSIQERIDNFTQRLDDLSKLMDDFAQGIEGDIGRARRSVRALRVQVQGRDS